MLRSTKSKDVAFHAMPASYLGSTEWLEFSKEFTRASKLRVDGLGLLAKHCQKSMWVVKPSVSKHAEGVQVRPRRLVDVPCCSCVCVYRPWRVGGATVCAG